MNQPIPVNDSLDDDRPVRPDPSEDALKSAQCRRYWREQLNEGKDDKHSH